jgi:hypothetical protein
MGMEEPHAHMGESMESLSALSFSLPLQVLRQLRESLCFIPNSVLFCRSGCTPSSPNRGLHSVRISMGERRKHGRIALAWKNRIAGIELSTVSLIMAWIKGRAMGCNQLEWEIHH